MTQRTQLIYVLSTGRSGSTLLEMLLASSAGTWTVGEIQLLPFEIGAEGYRCGCGVPVEQCDVWKELIPALSFEMDGVSLTHFRSAHNKGRTWRTGQLFDILVRGWRWPTQKAKTYGDINHALFEAVRHRAAKLVGAAPKWFIDASKDPYRLYWLRLSNKFDVRVVHLVRGPHGFVHSSMKGQNFSSRKMRYLETARLSLRWSVANVIFALVCRRTARRGASVRVRYEDLAQEPEAMLAHVGKHLALPLSADPQRFRDTPNHAIAGNQTRWRNTGVQLDEAWRRDLGMIERTIVSATCAVPQWLMRAL